MFGECFERRAPQKIVHFDSPTIVTGSKEVPIGVYADFIDFVCHFHERNGALFVKFTCVQLIHFLSCRRKHTPRSIRMEGNTRYFFRERSGANRSRRTLWVPQTDSLVFSATRHHPCPPPSRPTHLLQLLLLLLLLPCAFTLFRLEDLRGHTCDGVSVAVRERGEGENGRGEERGGHGDNTFYPKKDKCGLLFPFPCLMAASRSRQKQTVIEGEVDRARCQRDW